MTANDKAKDTANPQDKQKGNLHAGHRQRMKERLLLADLTDWADWNDHQLLEALLFYSIPRADTNETAHLLLNKFKSIRGIMNASKEELLKVQGVGESTWLLFDTLRNLFESELAEKQGVTDLSGENALRDYFYSLTYASASEYIVMVFMNRQKELVSSAKYSCDRENPFVPEKVFGVNYEFEKGVKYCACAHVRPKSSPRENEADNELAYDIVTAIRKHSVELIDFFAVGNGEIKSVVNCGIPEAMNR